ncbi:MAG TPA: hypothetical protein VHY91_23625 [Pirellulales bacterium]|jgi:hypothetical protein|nr:hypothetical protein [Pirellulales bacterium]
MSAASASQGLNPFPATDSVRRGLWEMLVTRDFVSFLAVDWAPMEPDFWAAGFCGIDARQRADPADWIIAYPTVESYRDEWLRQARQFERYTFDGLDKLDFLYASSRLDRIEIAGDRALAHKKFDGAATTASGQEVVLRFQSIFHLARIENVWKIAGFVGYLPNPMRGQLLLDPSRAMPTVVGADSVGDFRRRESPPTAMMSQRYRSR